MRGASASPPLRQLLATLDADPARAGERYERIRARLVVLFRCRGCTGPEDLADETIDRVARRLEEGEVIRAADLTSYFVGVAGHVAQEAQRRDLRVVPFSTEQHAPAAPAAGEGDDELTQARRKRCLNGCLGRLRSPARELLVRYVRGDAADHARHARELGIEINALRIRAHRTRVEVEECVRACLPTN